MFWKACRNWFIIWLMSSFNIWNELWINKYVIKVSCHGCIRKILLCVVLLLLLLRSITYASTRTISSINRALSPSLLSSSSTLWTSSWSSSGLSSSSRHPSHSMRVPVSSYNNKKTLIRSLFISLRFCFCFCFLFGFFDCR